MNTIIVKTNDATQTINQVQVVTQDGMPTVITAMDQVNYEFYDTAIARAPNHIITKRVDSDLHVSFEENGQDSDLIIEGFYDREDSALLGMAEDGQYYYYVPDTGETYDYVTQLEAGDVEGQALGGQDYTAVAAIPWWIPVAAGLGLIGIIAATRDDDDNTPPPPPPLVPTISISGTTALNETESDGTASEAVYTVSLSSPSTVDTAVTVTISPGSADGNDYTAPVTQTITIPAGSTSATFSVPIIDDNVFEGPEDFDVTITSVDSGSATINPTQNTVNTTIYDDGTTDGETPVDPENPPLGDDTPVVSIIGTTSLNETDFDGTPSEAVYTVNLSNPSTVATSVTITITDGSTEGSADYTAPVTQTITIPAGSTSATFSVPIIDDNVFEGPEDFDVTITSVDSGSATINPTQNTVNTTIYDDGTTDGETPVDPENPPLGDDTPVVSVSDDSVIEGDTLVHTITLSNPSATATVYSFSLADGTATAGADYSNAPIFSDNVLYDSTSGTITVPAGLTSFTVSYPSLDDVFAENDETTLVTVDGVTGTGTIVDDIEVSPETTTITLSGASTVAEGGVAGYTVSIDTAPVANDVTVDVTYSYISASSNDIVTTTTQVTIPVGMVSQSFTVEAVDDDLFEGDEIFNVTISNPVAIDFEAISIVNDTVETTITDNDSLPTVTVSDDSVIEGDTLVHTITLSNPSATATVYSFSLADGTATAGADYSNAPIFSDNVLYDSTSGTITVPAGLTSFTVSYPSLDDVFAENDETTLVTVDGVTGTGTIVDDIEPGPEDTITVSIADNVGDVSEGDSGVFPISLTDSNGNPVNAITNVVVDVTYSGIAIDGTDFTGVATVTIPAGSSSANLTLATIDDFIAEGSELVGITISNPVGGGFEAIVLGNATADMNIVDEVELGPEDTITVSIADNVGDVSEGDSGVFPISLTDSNGNPVNAITNVVVDVTYSGIAIDGTDFTGVATVTIPAGSSSANLTLATIDDFIAEGSELVGITISNPVGGGFEAIVLGNATADMNIVDEVELGPEDTITVSIADTVGDVIEGDSASFPISLTDPNGNPVTSFSPVTVDVTYSGIAANGVDFTGVVQVTIPTGSSSVDLVLNTIDDFIAEGSELVGITISNPVGGGFEAIVVGQATADMTIVDEADPGPEDTITVSIADTVGDVIEGDSASFPISLTDPNGNPVNAITDVVVDIAYTGQAIDGTDFTGVAQVTILAGTSTVNLDIATIDDFIAEGSELVNITISNPVGGGFEVIVVGQATADMNIVDETVPGPEDTITVSIADTVGDVIEGDSASFPISLTDANGNPVTSFSPVTVDVTYSGVAANGVDFTGVATVTIPAGSSSANLTLATIDDFIAEGSELVGITISNPVGGGFEAIVVGQATADMNIVDEADPGPEDTITVTLTGDTEVNEGADATYLVALSTAPINNPVTVDVTYSYPVVGGADGNDIVTITTQVTIPVGMVSQSFTVEAVDDDLFEGDEIFNVTISNPVAIDFEAISIVNDTVETTITDNDSLPTVSITGPIIVDESAGTVTYNITLTNPSVDTVTVDYTTADGSANAGLDYAATAGTVTFAPNEISKTVTVAIIDDNVAENNEDYSITLSNPSNAGIDATQNSVITTIVDNDTAPMIDSITSTTVSEEGLPGGLADNDALAGFDDTTNVTVQTGVITVFDPDSMSASDFSVILNGPAGITTSGALVSWTPSANGLIGSAIIEGNLVEVITMTVDAFTDNGNGNYSANYTATLLQPIDHPDMRGEDHLDLSFTATVSDGTNISNSQSFDLRVEDDAPVAIDVDVDVVVQPVNTNLLLVVDVSGSMNGSVNNTTRLALAKQALIEAINKYDEYGEVKVRLVTFDGGNDIIGPNWVSAADALVQINSLTAGGQTNYDAALAGAMSAFGDPGKIVTTIGQDGQGNPVNNVPLNKAIFITDGEPTVGSGGPGILTGGTTTGSADRGIQPAEEAIWTNFLSTNKIDMTAFSIVTLGSNTELDPIAFDGSTGIDTDGLTVTPQTLEQSILDSIDISTTTGNLINSSGGPAVEFGADGNRFNVTKINIDGGLYTFDKSNNQLTTTVSSSVFSYDQATTTVTVNTTAGGVIAVDFVSADYSYQAPQQVQPDYLETISYTAVDSDGDEDTTTLTLDITYLATSNSNIVASSMSRVADSDDMLEASDASIAAGLSVQAYTIEDVHTLYLDSDSIDLATASNIGVIEMTNGHSQSLNISLQDVIDITDDNNTLFINGDSANDTGGDADTVVLANFAKAPASNEMGYDLYQNHSSNTELYIDTDITVL